MTGRNLQVLPWTSARRPPVINERQPKVQVRTAGKAARRRGMSFIDVRQSSEQCQAARPACVASRMSHCATLLHGNRIGHYIFHATTTSHRRATGQNPDRARERCRCEPSECTVNHLHDVPPVSRDQSRAHAHETRRRWRGARPPSIANNVVAAVIPPARIRIDNRHALAGHLTVNRFSSWDVSTRIGVLRRFKQNFGLCLIVPNHDGTRRAWITNRTFTRSCT